MNKNEKTENRMRIERIKRAIKLSCLLFFAVPLIISIVLSLKLVDMEKDLEELKACVGVSTQQILAAKTDDISTPVTVSTLENPNPDNYSLLVNEGELEEEKDPYEGYIKVCLTFDDGPSSNTDNILDILDEYGLKGTFFVNGREGFDAQYQRIVNEGHTLAMHSYSHVYKEIYADLDSFAEDLYKLQGFLQEKTGVIPTYYRFPGGSSNNVCNVSMTDCIEYLNAKGITYYDWNVSAQDAVPGGASATEIVNNIMGPINSGQADTYIVLMHDSASKTSTVEALPIIIEQIINMENVVIVPIDEYVTPLQHVTVTP